MHRPHHHLGRHHPVPPMPTGIQPENIVTGPDGALWFSVATGQIGRMTTTGSGPTFYTPGALDDWVLVGPNGQFWFAISGGIAEMSTSGVVTQFPGKPTLRPVKLSSGRTATCGVSRATTLEPSPPRGFSGRRMVLRVARVGQPRLRARTESLWFLGGNNAVVRMTLSGVFTQFQVPTFDAGLTWMTVGPDGALWFTESAYAANKIGRMTLPATPGPTISVGGVVPVYSTATTIQPGEWVSMYGTNLGPVPSVTWNGNFPTSLGGTSVTIDGKSAYLWYVSATQINLQAPDDTATGSVNVVVTTANGSATSTVTLAPVSPSFSLLDGKHVAGIDSPGPMVQGCLRRRVLRHHRAYWNVSWLCDGGGQGRRYG